jgi:uncharacterized damage-inducible protein DinB
VNKEKAAQAKIREAIKDLRLRATTRNIAGAVKFSIGKTLAHLVAMDKAFVTSNGRTADDATWGLRGDKK